MNHRNQLFDELELRLCAPSAQYCHSCRKRIETALMAIPATKKVRFNSNTGRLFVDYDSRKVKSDSYIQIVQKVCSDISSNVEHKTFILNGLDCPDCAKETEQVTQAIKGVLWAGANFTSRRLHVEYDLKNDVTSDVIRAIGRIGYTAQVEDSRSLLKKSSAFPKWGILLFSGICIAIGYLFQHIYGNTNGSIPFYIVAAVVAGFSMFRAAWYGLAAFNVGMNTLMTIAVIGAICIGKWSEAAEVTWLFALGNSIQTFAVSGTRKSLEMMLRLAPQTVNIVEGSSAIPKPIEDVSVGDIIEIKPGERIPLDGVIIDGSSEIDESALTGESRPIEKIKGDSVLAGSFNWSGRLRVEATKKYQDTALARMIHLVEEAQAKRAVAQQKTDRFAAWYTPIVLILALIICVVPPLFFGAEWRSSIHRALWLLLVSCPCALVISVPVAIVTAIGEASKHGVLVKGGVYLEQLAIAKAFVFDKTGTLSTGRLSVKAIQTVNSVTEDELIQIAASLESAGNHPISFALHAYAKENYYSLLNVSDVKNMPGIGMEGTVDGKRVKIGSRRILEEANVDNFNMLPEDNGETQAHVFIDGVYIGSIIFEDKVKHNSLSVIKKLKNIGFRYLAILSGDNGGLTAKVADEVGIENHFSSLLPLEKRNRLVKIRSKHKPIVMVGDGVNDTLALQASDVGIAMGAVGSDVAIESADIVLMTDNLDRIIELIELSRKMSSIIVQNILFSLLAKTAFVAAALITDLPLYWAVLGDTGVSLAVTLNSLRVRWGKSKSTAKPACRIPPTK